MLAYRSARFPVRLSAALLVAVVIAFSSSGTLSAQNLRKIQVIIDNVRQRAAQAKPPSALPGTTESVSEETTGEESEEASNESSEEKQKKELDRLLTRYERARECTLKLQHKPYKPEEHKGRALLVMDTIEYNVMPGGPSNGNRYLVGKLHLINLTDKPVTIARESIRLKLPDEKPQKQSDVSEKIQNYSFDIGRNQNKSFNEIKRPESTTVPPGETGWVWVYFADLELSASLPDAEIQLELDSKPHSLSLKSQIYGQLFVTRTEIGPEKSLALIEIGGRVNLAALSVLAELFDELVEEKIVRAVLVWKKGAQEVDSNITQYLYQYALNTGRENRNRGIDQRYPVLNEGMREVHMAKHPGSTYNSSNDRTVMHDEPVAAVSAALWSALAILPKEQLLEQIHEGHQWVRPAALSAGAAQLSAEELPLILEYSRNNEDPMLQLAAVFALRQFGDESAVNRLLELAESNDEKLTSLAIAGLSQSRFQSGRTALRTLLKTAEPKKRLQLSRVIAENPAPAFSDLYYENVIDPTSSLRVESLKALNAVGHEELSSLLKTCLDDSDATLRDTAFEIILARREPELEPMLEERVLARLEKGELTSNIQNYLRYTKHPAAIPMLMKRLGEKRKDANERQQLISLLSQIGDQRIGPLLVEIYPDLTENEQRNVLETLSQIQSPEFLKFAKEALLSKDSSLVYSSINALSKHDSLEAESILIEGYDELKNESYYNNLANVLGQIGSEEAEETLRAGRRSQNSHKRIASVNGLRYLQQRKPGYQYVYQANYQMRNKKWKEALNYINNSIKIDDSLAVAHAVKGTILLRMKKIEEAEASYQRAIELDEETGEAVVGRLRIKARQGKLMEAIEEFRKVQADFIRDNVFECHAGLLFADAVGIATQKKPPDKDETNNETEPLVLPEGQVDLWKKECLSWCSDAIRHGFNDRTMIRNSPELEPLKKHPDFEKAMSGQLPERELPAAKKSPENNTTPEKEKPAETAEEKKAAAAAETGQAIIQVNGVAPGKPVIVQPVVIDLPPAPR